MKTVVCEICKEEVSKRQTLHIGNGKRACRKHPKAQEGSAVLQYYEKKEREKREEQEEAERRSKVNAALYKESEPTCGVCGHTGMRSEEFHARLLVEMEKYELATGRPPNMFNPDPEELQKMKGSLEGVRCLFRVDVRQIKKNKVRLTRTAWQVAEMVGMTFVCADCMCKHNLERPLPNIDLKQMALLGTIVEVAVRPEARKKALDELSKDQ